MCIFTDLGGYIFGKTFKGPKLTKISPNKTYAGVFGSFVCSLIIGHFSNRYRDLNNLLNEAKEVFVKSELAIEGKTYMIA